MIDEEAPAAPRRPADAKVDPDAEALTALEGGIRLFYSGDLAAAHEAFRKAHARAMNAPRFMSWHGATLVLVAHDSNLGILYCDEAVRRGGPEPELVLNQARAYLALGQRDRAVKALVRGLDAHPGEEALRRAQDVLGWRRRPVFPFLSRSNPLNRVLGRLRHRLRGHPAPPAGEVVAAKLGQPPEPNSSPAS